MESLGVTLDFYMPAWLDAFKSTHKIWTIQYTNFLSIPHMFAEGFRECELNKLHACLLHNLEFERAFEIISCLMASFSSSIDNVSTLYIHIANELMIWQN